MTLADFKDLPQKPGLYQFRNIDNNKLYFGEGGNLSDRIPKYKHENSRYINYSIKEHGLDKFEVEILHTFDYDDPEERKWIEANYIECFETYKRENGYNILRYHYGGYGYKNSEEAKQKKSEQKLGDKNPMFGKIGELHPFFGKHHTQETCDKLSVITKNNLNEERLKQLRTLRLDTKASDKTKEKMSKSHLERYANGFIAPNKDKKFSEETCKKMSDAKKDIIPIWSYKSVKQIDKETNEVIKIWDSIEEASKAVGLKNSTPIGNVCNKRKSCHSSAGFYWEWNN